MIDRRAAWTLPLLLAVVTAAAWALSSVAASPAAITTDAATPSPSARALTAPTVPPGGPLRWIVAGGGPTPGLNQVQLEQDVALAAEVFAPRGPGMILFAGGPGSNAVQEMAVDPQPSSLRARLAALFAPEAARDVHYRRTRLRPDAAASAEALLAALDAALDDGDAPLTLYMAGHGLGGEAPHESRFLTWGADDVWVEDLAQVLDESPGHRPVRIVMTSCYAGGFAELAFDAADPASGPATTARCGLFATTWDRAAAGCDPNPDRGAQEGYGMHFLQALRGRDREGAPLDVRALDVDGDGAVSLLEAHTRARIASRSLDVPVTTSERFLRAAVDPDDTIAGGEASMPEERAVVAGLTERLGLRAPDEVHGRLDALRLGMDERAAELDRVDETLAAVEEELAASILHRWPILNDPWHPRFEAALDEEGPAIERFLDESALGARRAGLLEEREAIATAHDALLVEAAPHERLARALETLRLAAALRAEGGGRWLAYRALLACERGRP